MTGTENAARVVMGDHGSGFVVEVVPHGLKPVAKLILAAIAATGFLLVNVV